MKIHSSYTRKPRLADDAERCSELLGSIAQDIEDLDNWHDYFTDDELETLKIASELLFEFDRVYTTDVMGEHPW